MPIKVSIFYIRTGRGYNAIRWWKEGKIAGFGGVLAIFAILAYFNGVVLYFSRKRLWLIRFAASLSPFN